MDDKKIIYKRPCESLKENPTGFCPGCLHGAAVKIIAESVEELGQSQNSIHVLPVGCSTLNLAVWKGDLIGAAHGRAPAVATGIKRCAPERLVFTYQGDGDIAAIGFSEILSAANRGENFTVIFANNQTYGMTGGQMAPTTLVGQRSTTCTGGRDPETTGYPIKMCELISTFESPYYVARFSLDSPKGILDAKKGIKKAFTYQLEGRGFTFIELLTNCPTNWAMKPTDSLEYMKNTTSKFFVPGVYRDKGECDEK